METERDTVSLSMVTCPDCGIPFYARGGVAATSLWADHYAAEHTPDGDWLLCPDCRDGKCGACIGEAFDVHLDKPMPCECECTNKEEM